MFLAMVTPLLLFNIDCTSSLLKTFALRVPFSVLYRFETSARLIVLTPDASDAPRVLAADAAADALDGPSTTLEVPRSVAGGSFWFTGSDKDAPGVLTIVAGLEGAFVFSTPFVALLMPARPALLMPAIGTGFGKPAEGVTSIGPPNGSFTGVVVDGLAVWPCPETAVNIANPAISRIPRSIDHP